MKLAYVDTSCVVAVAFGERSAAGVTGRLATYDVLLSSNLLEAELRATARREEVVLSDSWLDPFSWVLPRRPLRAELARTAAVGYLRGADLWHIACALYVAGDAVQVAFMSLDERQREVAAAVGLEVPSL